MMSKTLILKLKEDKLPRLVTLSKARFITEEDVEIHFAWEYLKEGYEEIEKDLNAQWVDKAQHSILNSIVYQQRIYFCFERDNVRSLLSSDKNWEKPLKLDNNNYGYMIGELIKKDIIKLHDDTKKPHIYKVIHPEVLKMIKIDSEEIQLSQVIDYRDNNPRYKDKNISDGKSDGKSDVEKKRIREEENECESEVQNNDCLSKTDSPKKKLITFQQLLFREFPENFPSFDEIPSLAQLAVENCQDFDVGYSDLATFESHLKGMRGKLTPKQKKYVESLVDKFKFEATKYYNLTEIDDVELRQPTELKAKSIRHEMNSEESVQSNTLNVIKSTYASEKIKKLKARIEICEEEFEKREMEAELAYWEKTT